MHCSHQSVVTYLSVTGRLVRVLRGLGVPALFGWVAGCHNVRLLWPCIYSNLYPVAAAGVLLQRRGSFVVLVCVEGVWLRQCYEDTFNKEKKMIKSVIAWLAMRGRKVYLKKFFLGCKKKDCQNYDRLQIYRDSCRKLFINLEILPNSLSIHSFPSHVHDEKQESILGKF